MSATRYFLDTNILLYAAAEMAGKTDAANALIRQGGVVSIQVLNEFVSVARKKHRATWTRIDDLLAPTRYFCDVVSLTAATHDKALSIAERHQLHIYDANIWAAAILAGCDRLYSEGKHHGLTIEGVTLRDPFAA